MIFKLHRVPVTSCATRSLGHQDGTRSVPARKEQGRCKSTDKFSQAKDWRTALRCHSRRLRDFRRGRCPARWKGTLPRSPARTRLKISSLLNPVHPPGRLPDLYLFSSPSPGSAWAWAVPAPPSLDVSLPAGLLANGAGSLWPPRALNVPRCTSFLGDNTLHSC